MSDRCILYRARKEPMIDTDLDALVSQLQGAVYRAGCVRDWWTCRTHPTDTQVDQWLEDLNHLVYNVHDMLDDVRLGP